MESQEIIAKTILVILLIAASFWLGWFLNGAGHGTELLTQFEKGYLFGVRETTDLFVERLEIN